MKKIFYGSDGMTRKEFLDSLNDRLKRLPAEERLNAIKFYEEYFDEAGIENEQNVISELKSPAHIASKILSEYAKKEASSIMQFGKKKQKKTKRKKDCATGSFRAVWFTILAIFAAPIAVPLAVSFSVIVIGLSLGFVALAIGLLVGGGAFFIAGFVLLFIKPALAFLLIGLTLIAIGIMRLIFDVVKLIIKSISQFARK